MKLTTSLSGRQPICITCTCCLLAKPACKLLLAFTICIHYHNCSRYHFISLRLLLTSKAVVISAVVLIINFIVVRKYEIYIYIYIYILRLFVSLFVASCHLSDKSSPREVLVHPQDGSAGQICRRAMWLSHLLNCLHSCLLGFLRAALLLYLFFHLLILHLVGLVLQSWHTDFRDFRV